MLLNKLMNAKWWGIHSSLQPRTTVFLIRSYGAPNGTGRCPVAQCYGNTWATLVQLKVKLILPMVVALLDVGS